MKHLTRDILQELPEDAKICNIRSVYSREGRDMPWSTHTSAVSKEEFEAIKEECTQGKVGLRWYGKLVLDGSA